MADENPSDSLNQLWTEYARILEAVDDLELARWLSQTLGQLKGKLWRLSHPLVGMSRLLTQAAHRRGIWHKRLVAFPAEYERAPCCGAPLLPLVTRDVMEHGFLCEHCGATAVEWEEVPEPPRGALEQWAAAYAELHEVAHWDEARRAAAKDYDKEFEKAGDRAEQMLWELSREHLPLLLEQYPAVVWEDHDECLDVRPEEIGMKEE